MSLLAKARVSALQARAGEQKSSVVKLESAYSWSAGGESVSNGRHAEGDSGRIGQNRGGGIRAAASRIGGTIRGIRKADEVGCCGIGTNARIRELADAAINPRPDKGGAVVEERTPGDAVVASDPRMVDGRAGVRSPAEANVVSAPKQADGITLTGGCTSIVVATLGVITCG